MVVWVGARARACVCGGTHLGGLVVGFGAVFSSSESGVEGSGFVPPPLLTARVLGPPCANHQSCVQGMQGRQTQSPSRPGLGPLQLLPGPSLRPVLRAGSVLYWRCQTPLLHGQVLQVVEWWVWGAVLVGEWSVPIWILYPVDWVFASLA